MTPDSRYVLVAGMRSNAVAVLSTGPGGPLAGGRARPAASRAAGRRGLRAGTRARRDPWTSPMTRGRAQRVHGLLDRRRDRRCCGATATRSAQPGPGRAGCISQEGGGGRCTAGTRARRGLGRRGEPRRPQRLRRLVEGEHARRHGARPRRPAGSPSCPAGTPASSAAAGCRMPRGTRAHRGGGGDRQPGRPQRVRGVRGQPISARSRSSGGSRGEALAIGAAGARCDAPAGARRSAQDATPARPQPARTWCSLMTDDQTLRRHGRAPEDTAADRPRGRHLQALIRLVPGVLPVPRDVPHRSVRPQPRRDLPVPVVRWGLRPR